MMLAFTTPNTFSNSSLSFEAAAGYSSGSSVFMDIDARNNSSAGLVTEFEDGAFASTLSVQAVEDDHWTAGKNTRFKELAREEAVGRLSAQELAELEYLTRLRRFTKYPRAADEILWTRRQQKLTRNLVQAIKTYVEFHEAPRDTY
jgi:hypothetical protein